MNILLKKLNIMIQMVVLASIFAAPNQSALAGGLDDTEGLTAFKVSHDSGNTVILGGNCNPNETPANDYKYTDVNKKSCIGRGIHLDGSGSSKFKIRVRYSPGILAPSGKIDAAVSLITTGSLPANRIYAIPPGGRQRIETFPGIAINPVVFNVALVGDKACVFVTFETPSVGGVQAPTAAQQLAVRNSGGYGAGMGVMADNSFIVDELKQDPSWFGTNYANQASRAAAGYPDTNGLVNGLINSKLMYEDAGRATLADEDYPWHCYPVPPPDLPTTIPSWGSMISPVCTDYDTTSSQFEYPGGQTRSFTGVVVECIEDTMKNLFTTVQTAPGYSTQSQTFFSTMQANLVGSIRALLALYVIFFAFKYVLSPGKIKMDEFIWFGTKFGLVLYFAAGSGMTDLLPHLQTISKNLSITMMESSVGTTAEADTIFIQLEAAKTSLDTQTAALAYARRTPGTTSAALTTARDNRNTALEAYRELEARSNSFGYRYCDFRDLVAAGSPYPAGKDYMKLWDMIDCKFAKLIGVGENRSNKYVPQILVTGVAMLFTHPMGFLILPMTLIYIIFVLLIVIRIVHIYIIASMALMILVYMSPLIIPAALFDYTKNIFEKWYKQIIAYTIQPIILFGFLALMFALFDSIMYGGNHYFVPMSTAHHPDENKICMTMAGSSISSSHSTALCSAGSMSSSNNVLIYDANDLECDDEESLACIFQKVELYTRAPVLGIRSYYTYLTDYQMRAIFLDLIMLLLFCFISHSVLGVVEKMSQTLTNIAGGGATTMSDTFAANPRQIVAGARKGVQKARDKISGKSGGGKGGSKGDKTKRSGAGDGAGSDDHQQIASGGLDEYQ